MYVWRTWNGGAVLKNTKILENTLYLQINTNEHKLHLFIFNENSIYIHTYHPGWYTCTPG